MLVSELRQRTVALMIGAGVKMDALSVLPSQDSAVWSLLTNVLQKWTSFSEHLTTASETFAVTDGESLYRLDDTAVFGRAMLKISSVRNDDGWTLSDFSNEPGQASANDLRVTVLGWATMTPARPERWLMEGKGSLRLWPTPDGDYTFAVAGIRLHSVVDSDSDLVEVDLEDEDAVVGYCASQWALRAGQSNEVLQGLAQAGMIQAELAKARNIREQPHRGGTRSRRRSW